MKKIDVKKLVLLAMLSAIAYITVVIFPRIEVAGFLRYEPKDVIIVIGGFLLGPGASVIISVLVSALEMLTISNTGFYGFIMNTISSCAFALTAAIIYKKKHTLGGAVLGLLVGSITTVIVMLLWNYIITPWYLKWPRSAVVPMLLPIIAPFNAIKSGLNSALTLALYKPLVVALQKTRLLPQKPQSKSTPKVWVYVLAAVLLISCIVLLLALQGKL